MISTKTSRMERRMAIRTDPLWMPGPLVRMTMSSRKSARDLRQLPHVGPRVARRVFRRVVDEPIRHRVLGRNQGDPAALSDRDPRHRLSRLHPVASARSSMTMSTAWSSPFISATPSHCLGCLRRSRWDYCSGCSMPSYAPPQPRHHCRFRLRPPQRSPHHLCHQQLGPGRTLDRTLQPSDPSDR